MSLAARIDAELKAAMIAKDAPRLSTLRMLKSAVKNLAIEKGGADYAPTDEDVILVVRRELKKRQDSIDSFEKAGRTDLADKEKSEATVLGTFLPAAPSAEEVESLVRQAMAETGATTKAQMGAVMKAASALAQGRVDGRTLSATVQKLLA
jgi:uncharacterized protein YqeY